MEIKKIYEGDYIGKKLTIKGWIRSHRKGKDISFIDVYDGTTFKIVQVVYDKSIHSYQEITKLLAGSSIVVEGILKKSKYGLEIDAIDIKVIGYSKEEYPIQPKKHSLEFLREEAHLRCRTKLFQVVFRMRSIISMAIHDYFTKEGFLYLHAPIFTSSDCEGAGEMFKVSTLDKITSEEDYKEDFFKTKVGLSVSTQFEAEAFALAFSKVYTFGPTFRADKSHTSYHLAEFWQIEPEVAFCDLDGIMDIAEDMMKYVIKYTLDHAKEEIDYLDKSVSPGLLDKLTKVIDTKFKRISYKECIDLLIKSRKDFEFKPYYGCDIAKEHEKYLTELIGPFFLTYFPKELKAFYMKDMQDGTVAAADLELPGIGETFGMSERENDYEVLIKRMESLKMKTEEYDWYLDLRRFGSVPHSGYGIGFERLVMYLTGIESIKDVTPFPRYHGSCKF